MSATTSRRSSSSCRRCGISHARWRRAACGWTTSGWTTRRTPATSGRRGGPRRGPACARGHRLHLPGEWRVLQEMRGWEEATGLPRRDPRRRPLPVRPRRIPPLGARARSSCGWSSSTARCAAPDRPADGRRRAGRRRVELRRREPQARWRRGLVPPAPLRFPPDAITREVMELVEARFADHFGDSRRLRLAGDARRRPRRRWTISSPHRLPRFGDYQDAMARGEALLFHALISTSLNAGLLDAARVCEARRGRLSRRRCAAERGGGLHPPDPRLAGIRARHLLAEDAGLCRD